MTDEDGAVDAMVGEQSSLGRDQHSRSIVFAGVTAAVDAAMASGSLPSALWA